MTHVFFYHPFKKPSLKEMYNELVQHEIQRMWRIMKTARGRARRLHLPVPQDLADVLNLYELIEWRKEKKRNATVW